MRQPEKTAPLAIPARYADHAGTTINGAIVACNANWNRLRLLFQNDSDTPMRVHFGVNASSANGILVQPGGVLDLPGPVPIAPAAAPPPPPPMAGPH